jgi:small subunit ribosomal protein S21
MIIVNVSKEKNLESALKKYKYKVQKTKQNDKLREKQEYTKPSVAKRSKKLKAIYKQQLFTNQEKSN